MSQTNPTVDGVFGDLGVSPKLLARLTELKFTTPTPIQQKAIPIAITGQDVIGIAQTGTGKTLAFGIPLLEQIARTKKQALIILPTRELAMQVDEMLEKLGQPFGLRRALLIGGASAHTQIAAVKRKPHVLVGTPGRILDHLQSKKLTLRQVGIVVLDEADRMLDMGFAPQITRILKQVPDPVQTMLFSATMPSAIIKMAATYMKTPVQVEVARAGSVAERVNQELFIIQQNQKVQLLEKLLEQYPRTVLIFSRTKHGAKRICRDIKRNGHSAAEIHSNLTQSQRKRSLEGFKSGKFRVLVATDIAARGIDVTNIELVINYDLPDNLDDYVHRVGRTGRAGLSGHAISFVTPDQRGKIRGLERLVREKLAISPLPMLPPAPAKEPHHARPRSNGYGRRKKQFGHRHETRGKRPHARTRRKKQVRMHH